MSTSTTAPPLPAGDAFSRILSGAADAASARELIALTPRLCSAGRPSDALAAAQCAVALAEAERDPLLRIQALRARARAQSELTEYSETLRSLLEAQALNVAIADDDEERLIQSALGLVYSRLGDRADAIAAHENALALSQDALPGTRFECLSNLGLTLVTCERPDEALVFLREALDLTRDGEDAMQQLRGAINVNAARAASAVQRLRRGDVEGTEAEFASIHAACESTLASCVAAGADGYALLVEQHIGVMLKDLGRLAEARTRLESVARTARERGWKRVITDVEFHLAGLLAELGEFADAERMFDDVLAFYRHAGYKTYVQEAHRERAAMFERMSDFQHAYGEMRAAEQVRLDMAASEEKLRVTVRTWRDEYAVAQQAAEEAARQAQALAAANAALIEANRSLDHAARHDPLTGLPNRRAAEARLAEWFAQGKRGRAISVALADIDHFKSINDRWSHVTGDAVLKVVAALLRAHCRDGDVAARHGGDEFVLLFPDTTAAQARVICNRLVEAVAHHDWSEVGDGLAVTVSIGVSDSGDRSTPETLYARADRHLYQAKAAGRNQVR